MAEREYVWPVRCSKCEASRDSLDDDVPCPSCGSTALTVHVSLNDAGAASEALGVTASYEKERPWQEKWGEAEAAFQAVTEVYSVRVAGSGADEWKSIALSFFRICHELPEALMADSSVSELTKRFIRKAASRGILKLVADVDNTRKHGGRDPDKCHAHIGEISWGDGIAPTMMIVRECPGKAAERFDVLVSATAVMSRWRDIFSQRELAP